MGKWLNGAREVRATMDNGAQTVMANGDKENILTSSTASATEVT